MNFSNKISNGGLYSHYKIVYYNIVDSRETREKIKNVQWKYGNTYYSIGRNLKLIIGRELYYRGVVWEYLGKKYIIKYGMGIYGKELQCKVSSKFRTIVVMSSLHHVYNLDLKSLLSEGSRLFGNYSNTILAFAIIVMLN